MNNTGLGNTGLGKPVQRLFWSAEFKSPEAGTSCVSDQIPRDVVAAIIRDGDRLFVCRRPAHKARGLMWEFPGGKVETGESGPGALVRECREELGVKLRVGSVFTEVTHKYPDITVHLTFFNAEIVEGSPKLLEHDAFAWVTPDEAYGMDFCPADGRVLEMLKKGTQE